MGGAPWPGTLLGSCCPLRSQSACGGTRSRCALVRVGCRSGGNGFVDGPTPFGWQLQQDASCRKTASTSASIEKPISQRRQLAKLLLPASREAKGAEVSADESITACGCEEVDAAVPLAGRGMEGLLHEDSPFHLPWPLAAYQSFYTKTLPFTPPGNC